MAGMVIYWYDYFCFGIVGIATLGALYVLCCRKQRHQSFRSDDDDSAMLSASLVSLQSAAPGGTRSSSWQLWTCCWHGMHPAWLLATRFLSLVVLSIFLIWDVLLYDSSIFLYYTEWTFTLLIVYFAIGTVISAYGCVVYYSNKAPRRSLIEDAEHGMRDDIHKEKNITSMMKQGSSFWSYLLPSLYQTCGGAVILTDIVFWFVILPFLSNQHTQLSLLMGGMHTLNIVFLLIESSLDCLEFTWSGLAFFVLWSCCYVIFQWVVHALGLTWWPYPFLELSTPWAPLWYFCLAVLHLPCYGIYWLLVLVKDSTFSTFFPQALRL